MSFFVYKCQRCGEYVSGTSYRVLSETHGQKLLDMVVCYECYLEASQLGLDAEPIELDRAALH